MKLIRLYLCLCLPLFQRILVLKWCIECTGFVTTSIHIRKHRYPHYTYFKHMKKVFYVLLGISFQSICKHTGYLLLSQVALVHGISMGGGASLMVPMKFSVVTEKSVSIPNYLVFVLYSGVWSLISFTYDM